MTFISILTHFYGKRWKVRFVAEDWRETAGDVFVILSIQAKVLEFERWFQSYPVLVFSFVTTHCSNFLPFLSNINPWVEAITRNQFIYGATIF
jgi:hypothetical protein